MFNRDLIKADSTAFISMRVTVEKCRLWSLEDMEMIPSCALYTTCDLVFQLPDLNKEVDDGTNLHIYSSQFYKN